MHGCMKWSSGLFVGVLDIRATYRSVLLPTQSADSNIFNDYNNEQKLLRGEVISQSPNVMHLKSIASTCTEIIFAFRNPP